MKGMITIRKKKRKMIAIAVLGSVVVGTAVFALPSPSRVLAESTAMPTPAFLQETADSITAIVNKIQASPSSVSPAEEAQLIQAITALQNILRTIVPNTVGTPFH